MADAYEGVSRGSLKLKGVADGGVKKKKKKNKAKKVLEDVSHSISKGGSDESQKQVVVEDTRTPAQIAYDKIQEKRGAVFQSVGKYEKARQHLEKSLAIQKEIGDRNGEASSYANLGAVFQSVGKYVKAKEHLEKSKFGIHKEFEGRNGEAAAYKILGAVYVSVGEYDKAAERILKKAEKTHKQRVEKFNEYLDELTEHYDIPKVSWTK